MLRTISLSLFLCVRFFFVSCFNSIERRYQNFCGKHHGWTKCPYIMNSGNHHISGAFKLSHGYLFRPQYGGWEGIFSFHKYIKGQHSKLKVFCIICWQFIENVFKVSYNLLYIYVSICFLYEISVVLLKKYGRFSIENI